MCLVIILLMVILIIVCIAIGGGGTTGISNVDNTATSNAPLDEELVQKLLFFLKVGFGVIRAAYDEGLLMVTFGKNDIYIYLWADDGMDFVDGFIRGSRGMEDNNYNFNSTHGEFGFKIGEYKRWRSYVAAINDKTMRIQIPGGLNNRYYERVKRELEKMYSSDELKKIRFTDPTATRYGEIKFDYYQEKAYEEEAKAKAQKPVSKPSTPPTTTTTKPAPAPTTTTKPSTPTPAVKPVSRPVSKPVSNTVSTKPADSSLLDMAEFLAKVSVVQSNSYSGLKVTTTASFFEGNGKPYIMQTLYFRLDRGIKRIPVSTDLNKLIKGVQDHKQNETGVKLLMNFMGLERVVDSTSPYYQFVTVEQFEKKLALLEAKNVTHNADTVTYMIKYKHYVPRDSAARCMQEVCRIYKENMKKAGGKCKVQESKDKIEFDIELIK